MRGCRGAGGRRWDEVAERNRIEGGNSESRKDSRRKNFPTWFFLKFLHFSFKSYSVAMDKIENIVFLKTYNNHPSNGPASPFANMSQFEAYELVLSFMMIFYFPFHNFTHLLFLTSQPRTWKLSYLLYSHRFSFTTNPQFTESSSFPGIKHKTI